MPKIARRIGYKTAGPDIIVKELWSLNSSELNALD